MTMPIAIIYLPSRQILSEKILTIQRHNNFRRRVTSLMLLPINGTDWTRATKDDFKKPAGGGSFRCSALHILLIRRVSVYREDDVVGRISCGFVQCRVNIRKT